MYQEGEHKECWLESFNPVLKLRRQRIVPVIPAGTSTTLCTQAHMHELTETKFEVDVVNNALVAAKPPLERRCPSLRGTGRSPASGSGIPYRHS